MQHIWSLAIVLITILVTVILWPQASPLLAKVEMLPGTVVDGDDKVMQEILAAFNRADEALRARDLDALMNLYSKTYSYHRLSKSDLRKIWERLLANYDEISSVHLFERVRILRSSTGSIAQIRCTGNLTATPKGATTPVNLDSWFGEIHYLVKEDGVWRIRGHAGDPPVALEFGVVPFFVGTAPHPLF